MGPTWPFLLMYGSHDMRHTGFSQVDGGQRDPQGSGRHRLIYGKLIIWQDYYMTSSIIVYGNCIFSFLRFV